MSMALADSILEKHAAGEEEKVQAKWVDLSLGLKYGDGLARG
jgi:hypothetical protein